MKFIRLSLACLLFSLVGSYAFAEKYEYIMLKQNEIDEKTTIKWLDHQGALQDDEVYLHDSFRLEDGDFAQVVGWNGEFSFLVQYDNDIFYSYQPRKFDIWTKDYGEPMGIAGPCTVYLSRPRVSYGSDITVEDCFVNVRITRSSDRSSPIEYAHIFFTNEKKISRLKTGEKVEDLGLEYGGIDYSTGMRNLVTQFDASLELENGDEADIIAISDDGYIDYEIFVEDESGRFYLCERAPYLFIGPCTIYFVDVTNRKLSYKSTLCYTFSIKRGSETGSKTLAMNGDAWHGSDDGTQNANNNSSSPVPDPNGIKYDQLLGWCYFTDTPWLYSYTNGSWYYMHALSEGIFVWNANFPDNGWQKLRG